MRISLKALLVVALLILLPVMVMAQAISGDLVGTVKDSTGAVVASANIEATNLATHLKVTAKTTATGDYHFINLPVGHYSVRVTSGSMTGGIKDVEILLNKTATVNIVAGVASAATTVEVTEQAITIDTTTPQIQSTFQPQQMENLPITSTGSGVINLSLLNAGVATQGGIALGTGPSISGQRPRNNNFTVEGVDNNNKGVTGPLLQIPNDAVDNFTVLQNQFSPEFGHSSGGQFNQTIKSGSNNFHGSLYEYFQNRNLNAQDSLVAQSQIANGQVPFNTRYDNNRFGGTFGGPVIKDKLFFFTLLEYNPIGNVASSTGCVPTAAGYTALLGLAGVDTTNVQQFQKYAGVAGVQAGPNDVNCAPTTSVLATDIPIGDIGYSGAYHSNILTTVNSVDYNISAKDQLRVRYSYEKYDTTDTAGQVPTFWMNEPNRYHLFTLGEYHNFTPNINNEFRLGFNRYAQTIPSGNFQFPGLGTFPNLIVGFGEGAGVQLGPDPNAPQFTYQNTYQLVDNLSWLKGNHNFKFGIEYRDYISPQGFTQRVRGDYDYTTFAGYFTDQVPDYLAERSIGNMTYYGNQNAIYWYVNDEYRLRSNFAINAGVRYEFTQVPLSERNWQSLNSISNVPGLINFNAPQAQKGNFAPRVGFAYSPGSSGNTSIRGGFAMAYDVLYDNLGLLSASPQVQQTCDALPGDQSGATSTCFWKDPSLSQGGFLASGGLPYASTVPPITDPTVARNATTGYIPNQQLPYSETWSLGIQHTFASKYVAEVRYVGTRGIHLPVQDRLNRVSKTSSTMYLPTYLTAPSAATLDGLTTTLAQINANSSYVPAYEAAGFVQSLVAFEPYGASKYHGLQAQITRNLTQGLQFQAAWTWSHAEDNSTADVFSTYITPRRPEDFQCVSCDWGTSALDHRHRITLEMMWDVPIFKHSGWVEKNLLGNWQVSPIYTFQSPEMATVQSGVDTNLNGDSAGDRVIYNPAGIPGTGSGVTLLCNGGLATAINNGTVPTGSACGSSGVWENGPLAGQSWTTTPYAVAYVANSSTAQYIVAGKGARADTMRNTLALPYTKNVDLTIAKNITITERQSVQFQLQATNVLNSSQYIPGYISDVQPGAGYIGSNILNMLVPGNPGFNNPAAVFSNHPRNLVLVLKYNF